MPEAGSPDDRCPGPGRPASMKEVAALAGVSLGTVSNVLNRPDRVSSATRTRVEEAMAQLHFVRNESARQLRAGQSRMIVYVMLDGGNPFFTDVARGIADATDENGSGLFLCDSGNHAERERAYLSRLEQQRVQGILITPVDPDAPALRETARRGTPLVIVDRAGPAGVHCSVAVDDVLGGELAVRHLLETGHRRVAFIGGPAGLGQVADRREGACRALRRAGLGAGHLVDLPTAALTVEEGRTAGARLARLPAPARPTAAFCANDLLALGVLQTCVSRRLDVPGDLAIVGYDDIDFAAAAAVPLTSVRQPRRRLGRAAAELLLRETEPEHEHRHVLFTPELVIRSSTVRAG